MTGVTFMADDLNGKRLELLRELIPTMTRVAIIANPEHPGEHQERAYSERRAEQSSIGIDYHPTRSTEGLKPRLEISLLIRRKRSPYLRTVLPSKIVSASFNSV